MAKNYSEWFRGPGRRHNGEVMARGQHRSRAGEYLGRHGELRTLPGFRRQELLELMRILFPRASELLLPAFPALLFLLLPIFQAFAQPTGAIRGIVLDASSGSPLADVNIVLKGTTLGAAADREGKFIIANVPPGRYVLSALAVGYETAEVPNVSVRANDTTSETIRLKESSIPVGEVVVYGASLRRERIMEAPAAVSTIE